MALVDDRTVILDRYRENTGDNGFHAGHFYHAKAPGGAFLGVVPYRVYAWLARRPAFEPWEEWSRYVGRALYAVTCFVPALLSAAAGVVLLRLCWRLFGRPAAAFGAVVLYAFATNAFIYSAFYEAHQMAGALIAIGLYLAWRARDVAQAPSPARSWQPRAAAPHRAAKDGRVLRLVGAGLALGFAAACEFQDTVIVLAIAIYLAAGIPRRRRIAWLVPGAALPMALVMVYNWAAFGSPLSLGYAHQWGGWEALHQGPLLGFGPPRLSVLGELLFGARLGLFIYTPAAALAVLGGWLWWRSGRRRAELVLAAGLCALFPIYLSGFANALSGTQFGPRMLVAIMPFAGLMMVPAVMRAPRLSLFLGLVSGLFVLAGAAVCPEVLSHPSPPLFHRVLVPFAAGSLPRSVYGFVPLRCPRPVEYEPFNLGMLLGLRGHASLLPYLVWWLAGFLGILRRMRMRTGTATRLPALTASPTQNPSGRNQKTTRC